MIWWRMAEVTATWCGLSALAAARVLHQTRQPSEFHLREQANPRSPRRHHLSAVDRWGDSRSEQEARNRGTARIFVGILTHGVQFRCPSLAPVSGHILTGVCRTEKQISRSKTGG